MLEFDLEVDPDGGTFVRVYCPSCRRLHRQEPVDVDLADQARRHAELNAIVEAFRAENPDGHTCPDCGETSDCGEPFGWDPPLVTVGEDVSQ